MLAFIIKLIATLTLPILAAKLAADSKKEDCGGDKINRWAHLSIATLGFASGIIALLLPPAWMLQVIFIVTYSVLQLVNTEGKYRATSWSLLSLHAGIMLVVGMFAWQDEIGGIRFWMVIAGGVFALVPIGIGFYETAKLDRWAKKEWDGVAGQKIVAFVTQHKKIIAAAVFLSICVTLLITAVFWAAS